MLDFKKLKRVQLASNVVISVKSCIQNDGCITNILLGLLESSNWILACLRVHEKR